MLGYRLKLIFYALVGILLAIASWVSVVMVLKLCEMTGWMIVCVLFLIGIAITMSKYAYNGIERLIKEWA